MNKRAPGYACPRCTVGRCLPRRTTFADVYQGRLLTASNALAYVCDVCHFAEFDREELEALLLELYNDAPNQDAQSLPSHKSSPTFGEGSG